MNRFCNLTKSWSYCEYPTSNPTCHTVDRKRVVGKSRIGSTWQTGWPPCRHTSGQHCLRTSRTGCPLLPGGRQGRQSWWWRTFSCTAPWRSCAEGRCCQKSSSWCRGGNLNREHFERSCFLTFGITWYQPNWADKEWYWDKHCIVQTTADQTGTKPYSLPP